MTAPIGWTLPEFAGRHRGPPQSSEVGAPCAAGPVLILGAPRSGTSWLGKILDSHPRVIYRHEPDDASAQPAFPGICPVEDIPRYREAARSYITQLINVRNVKSSGTRPFFPKSFHRFPAPVIRRGLTLALRATETLPSAGAWAKQVSIPDFIFGDAASITYVIKSVSLIGATALLAKAVSEVRIIAIFRHPCGHIASLKRALAGRTSHGELYGPRVLATARARELGMTREHYEALPLLDRWVWSWAVLHAKLFEEARDLPNVRLLSYERLCASPLVEARDLFSFAGLSWCEETQRFIERSTRSNGRERYFTLFRNSREAATKWTQELDSGEVRRFTEIVERVLPGYITRMSGSPNSPGRGPS